VLKFLKSIALLLVGAVLGGSLCAEMCAFASLAPSQQSSMPCHRQKTPATPECTHHDVVADRLVTADASDYLPSVTLFPMYIIASQSAHGISAPLTPGLVHWPDSAPLLRASVLRI